MRISVLAWRLLRFRVAAMVWTFMLLGAAFPNGFETASIDLALAAVALAASYVAATSANDLADEDVDRINHPGDVARPLVTGEASRRDLRSLHVLAGATALAAAAVLGWRAVAVVGASLAIGFAYSLPPARLSYRTWLAPLALAAAYVLVPYGLGAIAAGRALIRGDAWLVAALAAEGVPCEGVFYENLAESPLLPVDAARYPAWAAARERAAAEGAAGCPVAHRAAYQESVWLSHHLLLGDESDVDDIAAAIRKVYDARHALLRAEHPEFARRAKARARREAGGTS